MIRNIMKERERERDIYISRVAVQSFRTRQSASESQFTRSRQIPINSSKIIQCTFLIRTINKRGLLSSQSDSDFFQKLMDLSIFDSSTRLISRKIVYDYSFQRPMFVCLFILNLLSSSDSLVPLLLLFLSFLASFISHYLALITLLDDSYDLSSLHV